MLLLAAVSAACLVLILATLGGSSGSHRSASTAAGTPVEKSKFAAGACIAYAPQGKNRHKTVFLDAGHGGPDPGSIGHTRSGKTIYEADLTLPVEMDAMRILRREGYRVVVSRTRDSPVARLTPKDRNGGLLTDTGVHDDVLARIRCANAAHADILIGIYFDAGAANNAGSVTGYDADRPFSARNLRLARDVQHDVLAAMNRHGWKIPSEGVQLDDQLGSEETSAGAAYGHLLLLGPAKPGWVTTPSKMPGALIEPLFITDPFEGSIADSTLGQRVIAGGLAKAVNQYFSAGSPERSQR